MAPVPFIYLDRDQKNRYLSFFSDPLPNSHCSERVYTYLPTGASLPVLALLNEYRKLLVEQFGQGFVKDVQLNGSAVHWILTERRPNMSNLNLSIQIQSPKNWKDIDAVFKQAVENISGQKLPERWRSVHIVLQNYLQAVQLDELPAFRAGKFQPITIQTFAYNSIGNFTSADALELSLIPAMLLPKKCLEISKVPVSAKQGYTVQECLDQLKLGQCTSIKEFIPLIFQGARGYCHVLSYTGCISTDPSIDLKFGASLLPPEKADLERYLNLHYADDTAGKLIFLLNYHALVKRAIKDKAQKNLQIQFVFNLICKLFKSNPKTYTPEQMHAFFRYAVCYLCLLTLGEKPLTDLGEGLQKIPAKDYFLFTRIDPQNWRELQPPSEPVLTHKLFEQFTRIFPHQAENLNRFLETYLKMDQIEEEIPSFEEASLDQVLFFAKRDLNGHLETLQQRALELWKNSTWTEKLSQLLPYILNPRSLLDHALRAQDWKKMLALCQFEPDLKSDLFASDHLQKIPLRSLFLLFDDPNQLESLQRIQNQKAVKEWLLTKPVIFAQKYLMQRPDWGFEFFTKFGPNVVTEQNASLISQHYPSRRLEKLYAAIEPFTTRNPDLFIALFEKLYPKQTFEPQKLSILPKKYKIQALNHIACHLQTLSQQPELKSWFQSEARMLEHPTPILAQALKSLEPKPVHLPPLENMLEKGLKIISELTTESLNNLYSAIERIEHHLFIHSEQTSEVLNNLLKLCKNKKLPLSHRQELYFFCLHLCSQHEHLHSRFISICNSAFDTSTITAEDTLRPNRYIQSTTSVPYQELIREYNPQFIQTTQALLCAVDQKTAPAPSKEDVQQKSSELIKKINLCLKEEKRCELTLNEVCDQAVKTKNKKIIDTLIAHMETLRSPSFQKAISLTQIKLLSANTHNNVSDLTLKLTQSVVREEITAEDLLDIREASLHSDQFQNCYENSAWSRVATALIAATCLEVLEKIIQNPVTTKATPAITSMVLLCTADALIAFDGKWEYLKKAVQFCNRAEQTTKDNLHITRQIKEIRGKIFLKLPFYTKEPGYSKIFNMIKNKFL